MPRPCHVTKLQHMTHTDYRPVICRSLFRIAPRASRREPGRGPPPVGMITSLSRFITFRAGPQKRRKCARELSRSAHAGPNIDLVQIQRLLLQTDEDLREASLRP
jgi:hypothetical protein